MDRGPFRARRVDSRPPAGRPEPARNTTPEPPPQPKGEPAVVRAEPEPVTAPERQLPKPESIAASNTPRQQARREKEEDVERVYKPKLGKRWVFPVVALVVIVAIVVAGFLGFSALRSGPTGINKKEYQAVFFTNGQVYFGKLSTLGSGTYELKDIFYLQSNSASSDSGNPQNASTDSSDSNVSLIKLGNEIHGPEDEMIIQKDQVLFYENLKSSGKVAQSIAQYQKQNK